MISLAHIRLPLFVGLASFAGLSFGGLGCGDSGTTGGAGGGASGNGQGLSNPGHICIDNSSILEVKPAGLKIGFRVLDENGEAVRPLDKEGDIVVINDETGLPFSEGEGSSVSGVGPSTEIEIDTVLVLDMSDSIYENDFKDDVIKGAHDYIEEVVEKGDPQFPHFVAIYVFGRPDAITRITDFTNDTATLYAALTTLTNEGLPLGTTDLYDAYISGLKYLDSKLPDSAHPDALQERFLVLLSDGTHEAGNTENLRAKALAAKKASPATKYTIGIKTPNSYNACGLEELAGRPDGGCKDPLKGCREGITCSPDTDPPPSCTQFQPSVDPAALGAAFKVLADRARDRAQQHYTVGVCTPVALGSATATIQANVDGAVDSEDPRVQPQGADGGHVDVRRRGRAPVRGERHRRQWHRRRRDGWWWHRRRRNGRRRHGRRRHGWRWRGWRRAVGGREPVAPTGSTLP
ncbi:MAG: vWA domain-containing protein [Polyangiaceae bacterium]